MKTFSRTTTVVATGATALAFGVTLLGPAEPASADSLIWRIQSVTTGKCLQWNGLNKNVTLAKCAKKYSQYWGAEGTQVANLENILGGYCLDAPKTREKPPVGRGCYAAGAIMMNDKRLNHKTYMAGRLSYFKVVNGKVICGKRPKSLKTMTWKLIP
ncbi:ricin-type beta-trefoil lectin domain protein [Streptomyces murinus]|uniref:ricin-type beta-trefoil lectin domain protein n=1 Tax=Streptomyces murinus TaxID=33900 RepID=UPI0036E3F6A2